MSKNQIPQVCCRCGRTAEMIDILNTYFGKSLFLFRVGQYNGMLCSKCVKELRQIVFDQVFYGNHKTKVKTLRDQCIDILFTRNQATVEQDIDLCELLTYFKSGIEQLKNQKITNESVLYTFFQNLKTEWDVRHKRKCVIKIDKPQPNKLVINVCLLLSTSKSEGFTIESTLHSPNEGSLIDESIIPFKID